MTVLSIMDSFGLRAVLSSNKSVGSLKWDHISHSTIRPAPGEETGVGPHYLRVTALGLSALRRVLHLLVPPELKGQRWEASEAILSKAHFTDGEHDLFCPCGNWQSREQSSSPLASRPGF